MSYQDMTDDEIKSSMRDIIRRSHTAQEMCDKVKSELGCPYTPAIDIHESACKCIRSVMMML